MGHDPFIGKRFNQYEIEDYLGAGGMSTVYRAYQHGVNRTVAIKVLPRELLHQSDFLTRFKHEAEIIARLEHFHILPVYDAGEWDGVPYIVMRYLAGGTLADRLAPATTIPPEELVPVVRQVADALDYAHSHGVIHRDVKPSNILFDERNNAYLSDFGLAGIGEAQVSSSGVGAYGTPEYLAPEIASGMDITGSVDLYALGVIMFQAFTGQLPFRDKSPLKTAMLHVRKPAPMPRSINKYLSPTVEAVVVRALAKDPAARYPTVGGLASALEAAIKASPSTSPAQPGARHARPIPQPDPSEPPIRVARPSQPVAQRPRRTPWLLIGLLIVAVLLLLGAIQYTIQSQADAAATEAAVAARTQVAGATLGAAVGATQTSVGATQTAGAVALALTQAGPRTETPTPTITPSPTPTFTPAPTPLGGGSGVIAYVSEQTGNPEVFILNLDTNTPIQVTHNNGVDSSPAWSPDGRLLAFVTDQSGQGAHVALAASDGSDVREITHDFQVDHGPGWVSPTELAFLADDGGRDFLRRVNTDGVQKDITQVRPGMMVSVLSWMPDAAALIYYGYIPRGDVEISRYDTPTGAITPLIDSDGQIQEMAFSPDGSKAVYTQIIAGRTQLFLAGTNCAFINECSPRRITDDTYSYHSPSFSPDGSLLLVTANRAGNDDLWLLDLSGNPIRQVTISPAKDGQGVWQPKGG